MKLFCDFFESRNKKSDQRNFVKLSTSYICDKIDNETPVIFLLPPPELHLLIEPVHKIYGSLESLWPESKNWLKLCDVKKDY